MLRLCLRSWSGALWACRSGGRIFQSRALRSGLVRCSCSTSSPRRSFLCLSLCRVLLRSKALVSPWWRRCLRFGGVTFDRAAGPCVPGGATVAAFVVNGPRREPSSAVLTVHIVAPEAGGAFAIMSSMLVRHLPAMVAIKAVCCIGCREQQACHSALATLAFVGGRFGPANWAR